MHSAQNFGANTFVTTAFLFFLEDFASSAVRTGSAVRAGSVRAGSSVRGGSVRVTNYLFLQ